MGRLAVDPVFEEIKRRLVSKEKKKLKKKNRKHEKKNTSELQSLDPNGEKKIKFNPMFLSTMAHTKDLQISYCQKLIS